jgi:hypothetical protein
MTLEKQTLTIGDPEPGSAVFSTDSIGRLPNVAPNLKTERLSDRGTRIDRLIPSPTRHCEPSRLGVNQTGLVGGALLAMCHLVWVAMILTGIAQPLLDFIFWAHMIQPVYLVRPFDPLAALSLIFITFFSGYLIAMVGAILWNKLHRNL